MSQKNSSINAPIPQEIEVRSRDVGVEEQSGEATKKKDDGGSAEVEVDVACVDHRTYAGDEGKTEDVPVTVVHQIHTKKDLPSSGILHTVATKAVTTATGIKDTIVGIPPCNK